MNDNVIQLNVERRKSPRGYNVSLNTEVKYSATRMLNRLKDPSALTIAERAGFQNMLKHLLETAEGE